MFHVPKSVDRLNWARWKRKRSARTPLQDHLNLAIGQLSLFPQVLTILVCSNSSSTLAAAFGGFWFWPLLLLLHRGRHASLMYCLSDGVFRGVLDSLILADTMMLCHSGQSEGSCVIRSEVHIKNCPWKGFHTILVAGKTSEHHR